MNQIPHTRAIVAFDFVDAAKGYAGSADGRLYRTQDGGLQWTELVAPKRGPIQGVACVGDQLIWLATQGHVAYQEEIAAKAYEIWEGHGRREGSETSDWLEAERSLTLKGGLFFTRDEGLSWTENMPQGQSLGDISTLLRARKSVYVVQVGKIITQLASEDPSKSTAIPYPDYPEPLWGMASGTDGHLCLGGYDGEGVLWVTFNSGAQWKRGVGGTDNGVSTVFFLDGQHGWCNSGNYSATSTIGSTHDGGLTWDVVARLQVPSAWYQ